ncbi:hypothetical protein PHYNN_35 [Pantoea phage Phynn]|nr:hypothetical protein PHYNN_35 [Pantoea phage Phynn]
MQNTVTLNPEVSSAEANQNSPTLAERARNLMSQQFNEQTEWAKQEISQLVLSQASEGKLIFDTKRKIGSKFKIEVQTEVITRLSEWLKSEGFKDVQTVAQYRVNKGRGYNPHSDPYSSYSAETFLVKW